MTSTSAAGRTLFVTLPVADVARSKAFFAKLGFDFDPRFSDETDSACMIVNGQSSIMLGSHEAFAKISHLPMADPTTQAIALFCFSVDSRDEVDAVAAAALAEGAREADGAEDHGFMYTRSFFDLDGHGWQVMWLNPAAADDAEELAASSQGAGAQI